MVGVLVLFAVTATANLTMGQSRVLRYGGTLAASALASVAGVMLLLGFDTGGRGLVHPIRSCRIYWTGCFFLRGFAI